MTASLSCAELSTAQPQLVLSCYFHICLLGLVVANKSLYSLKPLLQRQLSVVVVVILVVILVPLNVVVVVLLVVTDYTIFGLMLSLSQ